MGRFARRRKGKRAAARHSPTTGVHLTRPEPAGAGRNQSPADSATHADPFRAWFAGSHAVAG